MNKIPPGLPKELFDDTRLEPAKIFDNLYCITSKSVAAWALVKDDSIVLLDAMWDDNDALFIIECLEKLGLNPENIKYIFITHGHGDHYGGAKYLKEKYNAKILLSDIDNHFMLENNDGPNGPRSPKCDVDIIITDEEKINLCGMDIHIINTPGHTPGCLSFIFECTNGDEKYNVGLWGGTAFPRDMKSLLDYENSIDVFFKKAKEMNLSALLTGHLFADDGYHKLDVVRSTGENLFLTGFEGVEEYFTTLKTKLFDAIEKAKTK